MATIEEYLKYLYTRQAEAIRRLKTKNLSFTEHTKFAYIAPDGKSFRNHRPSQALIDSGWKYAKVAYKRFNGAMSPKHPDWAEYLNAKRAATTLLACKLILKAMNDYVPEKSELSEIINAGFMRHHARAKSEQKRLAYKAYHRLRKLNNQLTNGRFDKEKLEAWLVERTRSFQSYPNKREEGAICLTQD
jgi:hypothetical protein